MLSIDIDKELSDNIFVYYEVRNFYQNHRRYFSSKSSSQLKGEDLGSDDVSACDPVVKNKDLWTKTSIGGTPLDPEKVAFPCGMMARSIFNDTFALYKLDSSGVKAADPIEISDKDIAWPDDKKFKYKNLPSSEMMARQWIDIENERFIVWMRAAATPTFRKLWGVVKGLPLAEGKYQLEIDNSKLFRFLAARVECWRI